MSAYGMFTTLESFKDMDDLVLDINIISVWYIQNTHGEFNAYGNLLLDDVISSIIQFHTEAHIQIPQSEIQSHASQFDKQKRENILIT